MDDQRTDRDGWGCLGLPLAIGFLILVLINFIVITKGAGRIAEVAARLFLERGQALDEKEAGADRRAAENFGRAAARLAFCFSPHAFSICFNDIVLFVMPSGLKIRRSRTALSGASSRRAMRKPSRKSSTS